MNKLYVIKIGGNIVDNDEALAVFLDDFANLDANKVLIHGGGKVATKISKALGIETEMIAGRRVTDQETVKVVTMVYAGLINKTIVAGLQARSCNAIGLSGADNNTVQSHKRIVKDVDYGYVGDVDHVNNDFLSSLLNHGTTPVLAPITHDKKGQLLNTNADTIASEIAISLSKDFDVELVYCFELPGVMKDINDTASVIPLIDFTTYSSLKEEGVIVDGMIPKLDNCFNAIDRGVGAVRITQAQTLTAVVNEKKELGTKMIKNV